MSTPRIYMAEVERSVSLDAVNRIRFRDLPVEALAVDGAIDAADYCSVSQGALSPQHKEKPVWRSRIMEKNPYGLVNVRTDGELIMCATLDETAEDWIIQSVSARFTGD